MRRACAYLVEAYRDIVERPEAIAVALERLPQRPGRKRMAEWLGLAETGRFAELADALIELHYDPAYQRSSRRDERRILGAIEVDRLDEAGQAGAANAVADLVRASSDAAEPAGEGA